MWTDTTEVIGKPICTVCLLHTRWSVFVLPKTFLDFFGKKFIQVLVLDSKLFPDMAYPTLVKHTAIIYHYDLHLLPSHNYYSNRDIGMVLFKSIDDTPSGPPFGPAPLTCRERTVDPAVLIPRTGNACVVGVTHPVVIVFTHSLGIPQQLKQYQAW